MRKLELMLIQNGLSADAVKLQLEQSTAKASRITNRIKKQQLCQFSDRTRYKKLVPQSALDIVILWCLVVASVQFICQLLKIYFYLISHEITDWNRKISN